MTNRIRTVTRALALALCLATASNAQTQPHRFDLRRNFFASDAEEARDRQQVRESFARLSALAARCTNAPGALAVALNRWSDTERRFRLHDLYFFARSALNTEENHGPEVRELRESRRAATRAVRAAICATPKQRLEQFVRHDRRLKRFAHFLGSAKEECRHRPDPSLQSAIDEYEFASDPAFYFDAVSHTDFGTVASSNGILDVLNHQGELLADPAPAVREETQRKLWEGYAKHQELFAHGLAEIVRACNAKAHLVNYASCVEQAFAAEELKEPLVRRWYDQIAASWPWARTVPGASSNDPTGLRFTFEEAADVIERAVAPLGPEYQSETKALLDPRNGRTDVEGGPHRLPLQGTASVDPIGTSIFYAFHFEGNYLDLMLLAHEVGHAVQAMMMSRAGVPPLNGRGSAWMTESFGRFNELLVADFLYRTAQDPARNALLRDELLRRAFVLYGAASEGGVELALHQQIARGGRASPQEFSDVTRTEGSRFSDRFQRTFDPLLWTRVDTYYVAPLQATSSMVSSIVALVLYRRFRDSPDRFLDGYLRLLKNGYDASSVQLLRRFVAIDVQSDGLVPEAVQMLQEVSR